LFVFLLGFVQLNGQRLFNGTKKISNARGTFFMHWGYNRSFYTQSDIEFNNSAYKFTLRNVSATDLKTENFGDYFRLNTFFNPQYSVKAGYYYMNHYAFTFGLDHMKYVMNDGNQVLIDGTIDTTLNAVWQGEYKNKEVITNANDFHYQYVGLNTIHLGLIRTDKLYQSKNKIFALSASYGLQLASVVSNTSLTFANRTSTTRALTGYNISVLANLRLEFFRVFYLQGQIGGGSINQVNAKTESDDTKSYAKNQFWYGQRQINIGFFHYFKPANGCNDCPVW
jgi:hypothetical protein